MIIHITCYRIEERKDFVKKVTKKLLLLMVMIMIFATMAISASAKVESGSFGKSYNLDYSLDTDTGLMLITGKGKTADYLDSQYSGAPWYKFRSSIKTVIISDGVTYIGDYAFVSCNNLESVYFGKDVKKIGYKVFGNCTSLKHVYLSENLNEIDSSVFYGCKSLKYIDLPESLNKIGGYAFYDCDSLEDITIPNRVTTIGGSAFEHCSNLKTVTLPVGITSLGAYYSDFVLEYCNNLTDIYYAGTEEQWKQIENYDEVEYSVNKHYEHTHDYLESNKIAASMTDDGLITYTCSTCGNSKNKIIYKINSVSLSADIVAYNGKVKSPAVYVKNIVGTDLVKDVDYTVTYDKGRINFGKYSVTVNFLGNYTGKKTLKFTIAPKAPSISSIKYQDGGKATVTWNKIDVAKGYQLQYATDSKFNNAKSVKFTKNSTLSKIITNISQNKMWYMRIRSYKTVSDKTYYSNWSDIKCIAVSTNKKIDFVYLTYDTGISKNEKVATIFMDSISPVGIGNTTITGKDYYGVKYTCYFYSLACDLPIFTGDSKTLPKHNGSSALTWKSANTSIATVNKQTVKGVKQGNVRLTAKKANVTYTVNVYDYDYKTMSKKIENYMYDNLKDPDSLKIYRAWKAYDKSGSLVVVWDYGASNGFGGMNRKYYMLKYSYEYGKFESSGSRYDSSPLSSLRNVKQVK